MRFNRGSYLFVKKKKWKQPGTLKSGPIKFVSLISMHQPKKDEINQMFFSNNYTSPNF